MPLWRKLHVKTVDSLDVQAMPDDFTRLLWVLLPLVLDSEGRAIDDGGWLRSRVFPLRRDVTPEQVDTATAYLAGAGMLRRYVVAGRHYLQVDTFHHYQGKTDREAASLIPAPPEITEENGSHTEVLHESGNGHVKVMTNARPARDLGMRESVLDTDTDADTEAESDAEKIMPAAEPRGAGGPALPIWLGSLGPAGMAKAEKAAAAIAALQADAAKASHEPGDNGPTAQAVDRAMQRQAEQAADADAQAHAPLQAEAGQAPAEPVAAQAADPMAGLTPMQRAFLAAFGAKRFKNNIQREAVARLEAAHGAAMLQECIDWAAKRGMSVGDAITSIESAIPNWGKPKAPAARRPPAGGPAAEPRGFAGLRAYADKQRGKTDD